MPTKEEVLAELDAGAVERQAELANLVRRYPEAAAAFAVWAKESITACGYKRIAKLMVEMA